jgi:hypothetical protein
MWWCGGVSGHGGGGGFVGSERRRRFGSERRRWVRQPVRLRAEAAGVGAMNPRSWRKKEREKKNMGLGPFGVGSGGACQHRPWRAALPQPPRPALLKRGLRQSSAAPALPLRSAATQIVSSPAHPHSHHISSIARPCSLHPRWLHLRRGSLAVAAASPMPSRLVAVAAEDQETESAMGVDWNCEGRRGSRRREEKR